MISNFWCRISGKNDAGKHVFLRDIWPSREEIQQVERKHVLPAMFKDVYSRIEQGSKSWQQIKVDQSQLYDWDPASTYIRRPPFFETMTKVAPLFFFILMKIIVVH